MPRKKPTAHNTGLDAELRELEQEYDKLHREQRRHIPRLGVFRPDWFYTLPEVADIWMVRDEKHLREELEARGCRLTKLCHGRWGVAGDRLIDSLRGPGSCDIPASGPPFSPSEESATT